MLSLPDFIVFYPPKYKGLFMSTTIQSLARKLLWPSLFCLCFLTLPFMAQAGQDTQAECLFNWAEKNYASLFAPSGTPTVFSTDSTSRHYSATNANLRVSTANNHVYYQGPDGAEQDVGSLSDWLPKAGCPLPPSMPECLFNWAEKDYPSLFAPAGSSTAIWDVYTYRHYSSTNAYLGVSSVDFHAYYLGPDGNMQNEGPLSDWTAKACRSPFANAGADQTALVGATVTLDGSASTDPDGNSISYLWTLTQKPANSQASLLNPGALHPSLVIDKPGTYKIGLAVNDGYFDSALSTVTINTQNSKPVANAGNAQTGKVGETLTLDGRASSDVDGDALSFHWTLSAKPQNSLATLVNTDTDSPSLTLDKPGSYAAQLIVNDGKADSAPATVTLSTINSKPVAKAGPAQSILLSTPATPVLLDGSGSTDADSDPLSFRWSLIHQPLGSQSALTDPLKPFTQFTPDFVGDYVAQLIVNDGHADSNPDTVAISVKAAPLLNHPPQITSTPVTTGTESQAYGYQITATDADNHTLAYSLATAPDGMTINPATGLIQWTLPSTGGPFSVVVNVNDGNGGTASQSFQLALNHNPHISSTPITGGTEGQAYRYQVTATDADNDTLAYSLTTAPSGIAINPSSGLLEWLQPTVGGPFNVAVSVTDGIGGTGSQAFAVQVTAAISNTTLVPPVTGLTRSEGESLIQQSRLNLGTASFQHSDSVADRRIIQQTPAANAKVSIGTAVDYVVSLGPDTGLPPNPATVAPPVDQTVATTVSASIQFLYSGPNAIQTGVAPGTIEQKRAAVLRGKVLDKQNNPLPGVTVTIKDHAEFGQTVTRADGGYDMAVNGGGVLTLNYVKNGYLPAQRQENVSWQDYASLDDVVLIPVDPKVSRIDLMSNAPIQVAQGSVMSDASGPRQVTLMIPKDTKAQVYNTDGSLRDVNTLTLHFSEYTVSNNGPATMPGSLPPTSGYTYALEITAEEATIKKGGKDVVFSQSVPMYEDNFLGMPVGIQIPVGYYDRDKNAWIPANDGKVIKILSVTNGLADIDSDGDNAVDSAAQLTALKFSDAERAQLAGLFVPGKTLWRTLVGHLSNYDKNYGMAPPNDAVAPTNDTTKNADSKPDQQCRASGSIIGCEGQTLAEEIPVTSTPFVLRYDSDRTAGRKAANTLNIQVSPASIPPSLKRIELTVEVAGRTFKKSFPAQANLTDRFEWDGLDAYGRSIQGGQAANVRIDYIYDAYYALPPSMTRSFGATSGQRIAGGIPARQVLKLTQNQTLTVGAVRDSAARIGAWSLDVHHVYDPIGKVLYQGDGSRRSTEGKQSAVVSLVAGCSSFDTSCFAGDGGPAVKARLSKPYSLAIAADGSLYIADTGNDRIRRVAPDGIINTVAGNGISGYGGDGGSATLASLNRPTSVHLGADGSLYIQDSNNHRIRRVDANGVINTVAGTGVITGPLGDGGPATQASLYLTDGDRLAVTPDGNLYILDYGHERLRRVSPDGIINTIIRVSIFDDAIALAPDGSLYLAGEKSYYYHDSSITRIRPDGTETVVVQGTPCVDLAGWTTPPYPECLGDGGPAFNAGFYSVLSMHVDGDGGLYVADQNHNRVRFINHDAGTTTTIAGGDSGAFVNGGLATNMRFGAISAVTKDAQGNVYFASWTDDKVYKIASRMAGFSAGEIFIASTDGLETYVFNANGRHLRTINTLTGTILLSFNYDSAGRLTKITDATGNATTIERDTFGNPTAIVAPFGQRTALTLDANGYLASVTNPAGETHRMAYTADGLLNEFKDPKGQASTFAYDSLGRLIMDQDAVGGSQNLARAELANGYEVTRSTGLNRATQYKVENLTTGDERRTITAPDSTQTVTLTKTDGTVQTTAPDGTVTTLVQGPDPRFSMQTPIPKSLTIATGGLTLTAATERTASLSNSNDPLSLSQQADTVTVNGRTSTRVYDAATRTTTVNSAAGRVSKTTLDAKGRLIKTEIAGLQAIEQAYDAQGHLAAIAQGSGADQRALAFAYNNQGWLKSVTDPLNRSVNYEYDLAGRVTRQVFPDGRDVLFGYDANGNLTSLTPPGQPSHLFKYTQRDQTQEYDPPGAANTGTVNTLYEYSLDKELIKITRPDGLSLAFTYDNAGRLSKLTTPDGDTGYAYADTGKLASITVPDGVKLAYSFTGALLTETAWTGEVAGKVGYAYDNDFRAKTISVNGANAIAYSFDADSLLSKAGNLTLTRSAQNGLLTSTVLGKLADSLSYNSFGELASYEAKIDGAALFKTDYTRDKLGRITRKVETLGVTVNTYDYGYDTAGRLIQVSLNGAITSQYAYDDNGNRLSRTQGATVTQGTYDAQDRLLTYGNASYTYTANGELKTKTVGGQTTRYDYDVLGNLRKVTSSGGGVIDYLIDGQNRRIGKKLNNVLVQGFLWQDQLKPIAELDGSGNLVARFVYATGVNVPDYMVKGGVTYRLVKDHLGSPRYVVNVADGTVIQQMDYDEFGNVLLDTNPGFQPFGFAGGLYDRDTGLVRFGARDYEAGVGRWTGKDPIGLVSDFNLYSYAYANPVAYSDLTGLDPFNPTDTKVPQPPNYELPIPDDMNKPPTADEIKKRAIDDLKKRAIKWAKDNPEFSIPAAAVCTPLIINKTIDLPLTPSYSRCMEPSTGVKACLSGNIDAGSTSDIKFNSGKVEGRITIKF